MNEIKVMRLRRADACAMCTKAIGQGERAGWHRTTRVVLCMSCLAEPVEVVAPAAVAAEVVAEVSAEVAVEAGVPGASLEREYQRRTAAREDRVCTRFPRIGGFLLAVTPEPATTRAFAQGAVGEQRLAERIEKVCGSQVLMLHNRRLGRAARLGDIDHIAVAPSGVFVIDAKHYPDAKVRVRRTGGLFSAVREQLIVRGRDRTRLVDGLERQMAAVSIALAEHVDVPVSGLLCFVDADLPIFGSMTVRGHSVLGLRGTATLLRRPGPVNETRRRDLWELLGRQLPTA